MTEQQIVQLGRDAQSIVDNAAFQNAFKAVKEKIVAQWKNTPIRDTQDQTLLLQIARVADIFESALIGTIEAGKFAQNSIDLKNAKAEKSAVGRTVEFFRKAA